MDVDGRSFRDLRLRLGRGTVLRGREEKRLHETEFALINLTVELVINDDRFSNLCAIDM